MCNKIISGYIYAYFKYIKYYMLGAKSSTLSK